jgi:hypothetical protein
LGSFRNISPPALQSALFCSPLLSPHPNRTHPQGGRTQRLFAISIFPTRCHFRTFTGSFVLDALGSFRNFPLFCGPRSARPRRCSVGCPQPIPYRTGRRTVAAVYDRRSFPSPSHRPLPINHLLRLPHFPLHLYYPHSYIRLPIACQIAISPRPICRPGVVAANLIRVPSCWAIAPVGTRCRASSTALPLAVPSSPRRVALFTPIPRSGLRDRCPPPPLRPPQTLSP